MAIKKSELYNTLWESCNALRGSMDASQYKDYVLMILFVKYLSDKALRGESEIELPEGCTFADFVALKQNAHIGEEINKKLEKIVETNIEFIGDLTLPNFNDDTKLGTGKTKIETLSKLIGEFEREGLDFSHNRAADDDLLGDAYEFLMKHFAAESGKSKGQFYTPAEVSRVMAKVLHMEDFTRASQTIYDMACGSGSLLLRALSETPNSMPTLYGQEKDSTTASLAKLNMLLHGIVGAEIKVGDTLNSPEHYEHRDRLLTTFDVCVANPPFSLKNWLDSGGENDRYGRWNENMLPPAKCGDFAFLLHFITSMKPEIGRGACIIPHGVLFRGNAEYTIRRHIVEKHYLKGIIGLPPNLFFGTGIPASILILDKKNTAHREGIFFIDAKDGFMKEGNKNRLREQDIRRIVDAWNAQEEIPHYARLATWEEIVENDYNLNISRYIAPRDTEIQQDIDAHLHGGLPAHDIEEMADIWTVCPTLKESLFRLEETGRYSLIHSTAEIVDDICYEGSFMRQRETYCGLIDSWVNEVRPQMFGFCIGDNPKRAIAAWSDAMLRSMQRAETLVDPYVSYDCLMNYWADTLQDDCYLISNDGWSILPLAVEPKSYKDLSVCCDLLPADIVINEYFYNEKAAMEAAAVIAEQCSADIDSFVEENAETFEQFEKVNEKVVKLVIKDIAKLHFTKDDVTIFKKYLDLLKAKKDAAKKLSELQNALCLAVVKKYGTLTNDEIQNLVINKKWIASIRRLLDTEMQTAIQRVVTQVDDIARRYNTPLPSLAADVNRYEVEVNDYLTQMGFHELLDGESHIHCFTEPWKKIRIGDFFEVLGNNTFSRDDLSHAGKVLNIHYGDVLIKYDHYIDVSNTDLPFINEALRQNARIKLRNGDVVMADTAEDETVGKACEIIGINDQQVEPGLHTITLRPRISFAPKFLGYYFNSSRFHNQILPLIQGTKVSSISRSAVADLYVEYPSIDEQQAIAAVLSGMDADIDAIEAKRKKYEAIKQGMMQQLLTGKIRLIETNENQSNTITSPE